MKKKKLFKSVFALVLSIVLGLNVIQSLSAKTWRTSTGGTYGGGNSTSFDLVEANTWYNGADMLRVDIFEITGSPNMLSYEVIIQHPGVTDSKTGSHVNVSYRPQLITLASTTRHWHRSTVNIIHGNS